LVPKNNANISDYTYDTASQKVVDKEVKVEGRQGSQEYSLPGPGDLKNPLLEVLIFTQAKWTASLA
jgi:hypothetical protein